MGTLPYRERSGSAPSPKFGYCQDPQGLITLEGVVSPRTSQLRVLVLNVGYIKCYLLVKPKCFNHPLVFQVYESLIRVKGLDRKFVHIKVVGLVRNERAKFLTQRETDSHERM